MTDREQAQQSEQPSPASPARKRRRWPRVLLVLGILFGALIALLPYGIEWGAERWLRDNGAPGADIVNVDLNLFSGELVVEGLQAGTQTDRQLRVGRVAADLAWQDVLEKRLSLEQVVLRDALIDVHLADNGDVRVGALLFAAAPPAAPPAVEAPADGGPWHYGVALIDIANVEINQTGSVLDNHVRIERLQVQNIASWDQQRPAVLEATLHAHGGQLQLASDVRPFSKEPYLKGRLKLDELDVADFKPVIVSETLTDIAGRAAIDMAFEFEYRQDGSIRLHTDGSFALAAARVVMPDLNIEQNALEWQGRIDLANPPRKDEDSLQLDGQLELGGGAVALSAQDLHVDHRALAWQGALRVAVPAEDDGEPGVSATGSFSLDGLRLDDVKHQLTLAAIGNVAIEGIEVATLDDVKIARVGLAEVSALARTSADGNIDQAQRVAGVQRINVDDIALQNRSALQIAAVNIATLGVALQRDPQGRWAILDALLSDTAGEAPQTEAGAATDAEAPGDAAAPFTVRLDRFTIGEQSWVRFDDASVKPSFELSILPLDVKIADINSAAPRQDTHVDVQAKLAKHARLSVQGTLQPFAPRLNVDMVVKLDDLDLPPLTAYAPATILRKGRLDADVIAKIKDDQLDVNNKLVIANLDVETKPGAEGKGLAGALDMPLGAVVDMLRDGDGNIKLEIPVRGDVNKPDFDLNKVIRKATVEAVKAASVGYLKYALQPFGAILLAGELVGKATALRLQPLAFAAGQAEIDAQGHEYLDKIAGLLQDRPGLKITFCGISTLSDKQALQQQAVAAAQTAAAASQQARDERPATEQTTVAAGVPEISEEQLLTLAEQRGVAVKAYLVEQQGAAPERLFPCHPEYVAHESAQPSVVLGL